MRVFGLLSFAVIMAVSAVQADTIELKNGKVMEGTFIGREGDTVTFEVDGIGMSFKASDVANIGMGSSASEVNGGSTGSTDKPNTSVGPGSATVAAGATVRIRLGDALNSGVHTAGHKFSGALEGALVADGVTVAPAGSKVYGVVTEAEKSGRVAGKAKLLITIDSINLNGQIVPVRTNSINAVTVPTGASSAGKVVRGAAIGGLADGSSGAKTGARVGLGAAILSGGNQVVIPPGTLMDFQLTAPLAAQ